MPVPLIGTGRTLLRGGVPGLLGIVNDPFNRADSALSLGSTPGGLAWSVGNVGDAATLPVWGISGNKAYQAAPGVGPTDSHAWVESGVADCRVACDVTVNSAAFGNTVGVLFRRLNSTNYFAVRMSNNADTVDILRNLAGVRSVAAGPAALTLADIQIARVEVVLAGTSIQVYVDGALKISHTDANMATATKHGLFDRDGTGSATFDNFEVWGAT